MLTIVPPPAGRHLAHGVLAAEEDALEIRAEHAVELLLGRLGELLLDLDRGVVHHHVEAPVTLDDRGQERLDVGLAADVGVPVLADRRPSSRRRPRRRCRSR